MHITSSHMDTVYPHPLAPSACLLMSLSEVPCFLAPGRGALPGRGRWRRAWRPRPKERHRQRQRHWRGSGAGGAKRMEITRSVYNINQFILKIMMKLVKSSCFKCHLSVTSSLKVCDLGHRCISPRAMAFGGFVPPWAVPAP